MEVHTFTVFNEYISYTNGSLCYKCIFCLLPSAVAKFLSQKRLSHPCRCHATVPECRQIGCQCLICLWCRWHYSESWYPLVLNMAMENAALLMGEFLLPWPCLITASVHPMASTHKKHQWSISFMLCQSPCSTSRTSQPVQTDCSHLGDKTEVCLAMHGCTVFWCPNQHVKYGKEQARCMFQRNCPCMVHICLQETSPND